MRAQGVGIDTTTPINPTRPHVHHQRHAAAPHDQRSARRHRHPDLVVFQTDLTAQGFYYNAGTPGVPNWVALGAGDNLGNHTATQALNLMGNALVGTGATLGTAVGPGCARRRRAQHRSEYQRQPFPRLSKRQRHAHGQRRRRSRRRRARVAPSRGRG